MKQALRNAGEVAGEGRYLVERLGGRWTPAGGMCRCPAHHDRTPSLSVRPGRRRLLLHCFAGCETSVVLRALEALGLLDPGGPSADGGSPPRDRSSRTDAALRLWLEARPVHGTPAASYLERRGLRDAPGELRFHPRTPFGPSPSTRFAPALIAAVSDDKGLVAIHRTLLERRVSTSPSKAAQRRGLGGFGHGAVRLGGTAPRLGLAEGIETALSASALFGLPCWATLGAERFGSIALPPDVSTLVLFLDHDDAGRRAERLARRAFAHLGAIEARYPDRPGDDWNDVLCRPGAQTGAALPASTFVIARRFA